MTMETSVLHEPTAGTGAWTLGNISEAFPGVATPLSWTFFGTACEAGTRLGFARIGAMTRAELPVPEDVNERFIAVKFGRAAGNISLFMRMGERMPGVDPAQMEEQLFGERRGVPAHPTRRRYPAIAARLPVEMGTALRRMRRCHADTRRWWTDTVDLTMDAKAPDHALRAVLQQAHARFTQNMALQATISMACSGIYDQVAALASEAHRGHPAALITGSGHLEETRIADGLWKIARNQLTVEEFLHEHGYQGPDAGQMHKQVWREDAATVERLAKSYAGLPEDASPLARERRQRQSRAEEQRAVLAALGPTARSRGRLVLRMAPGWIRGREAAKSGYLMCVDGARMAARCLGTRLYEAGVLADPEDVFYLTVDELVAGSLSGAEIGRRVDERRRQRDLMLTFTLPERWIGEPEPVTTSWAVEESNEPIEGVGVSPGVVEGRARVISDPSADDSLEPGEVLVCATTDPSWVSWFLPAAAIVIDIGGHLSHGSIVARELGIPCVTNTRIGTRRIRTGDLLRVDGTTGIVTPLSEGA